MGQPLTLPLPAGRDRLDRDWRGALGPDDPGEWVVGSELSYAPSRAFAVGGSYAMAVQSRSTLKVQDVDPAHYTVFMRWRF